MVSLLFLKHTLQKASYFPESLPQPCFHSYAWQPEKQAAREARLNIVVVLNLTSI